MVTIEQGFNGKQTKISIVKADGHKHMADVTIEQFGLPRILGEGGVTRVGVGAKGLKDLKNGETWVPSTTTAHYVSVEELLALRDEINQVLKEILNI